MTNPTWLPAAASTIMPASTASPIASWRPKNPLPPRLIDTTRQPWVRAQRTALATSPSKTWMTLSVARIGTSVAAVATPWNPLPSPWPTITLAVDVPCPGLGAG